MRALLVHPSFPRTYWGMEYARPLTGRRAILPPLGLLTVAALLPRSWSVRLVDLAVEPLSDDDLRGADVVLVGAMHVQRESFHAVARRARAAGVPVVAGGPYPTTDPEACAEADALVLGEAEDVMADLCADLEGGRLARRYQAAERPDLARAPVPRFDLLEPGAYHAMSVQFSRGCPFRCEFCDIVEIFGRVPRTKPPERLIAELDAVAATGFRGPLFVVDDNFIGNKPAVRRLLPAVGAWMEAHGSPFDLFTEASVDLASHDDLLEGMAGAGFTSVFVGIETPSAEALASARKTQNLRLDLAAAVEKITRAGLEVMGGFIVGFDTDEAGAFDRMHRFLAGSPIPVAMVGLLTALPSTDLWRRLEREGRLRAGATGDQFGRTNFETRLPEAELLEGYAGLLENLYDADAYFERCLRVLELLPAPRRHAYRHRPAFAVGAVVRSLWQQGVRAPYRAAYWRFLGGVLRRAPSQIARAFGRAITGEHLIRYTSEDVLPRLALALRDAREGAAERSGAESPSLRLVPEPRALAHETWAIRPGAPPAAPEAAPASAASSEASASSTAGW